MDSTQQTETERLRREHYNAGVVLARYVHEDLQILRVRPDGERPEYVPGQYTLLGLGVWEPRSDGVEPPAERSQREREALIRKPYSISCPVLDDEGRLVTCAECDFLEFYVTCVHRPGDDPPMLTPRLFSLQEGDRLYLGPHAHGHFTLDPVGPEDDVIFAATGTGEAPHNAMIAELLARGHRGRVCSVVCARYRQDLAYLDVHRELESRYENYRYFPLTTREPENVDPDHPDYVGKQYIQEFFAEGAFERQSDIPLDPGRVHAFLCGNPQMIGLLKKDKAGETVFPEPPGVAEFLTKRGFRLDEPRRPGNVHFEKYW